MSAASVTRHPATRVTRDPAATVTRDPVAAVAAVAAAVLAIGLAVLAAVVGPIAVPPAGAHSATGELTVLRAEQVGPGELQVEVGLVYADDGHLAEEATITATPTSPTGAALPPVELPRISGGRYGGPVAVDAPGTWSIAITSTDPTATAGADVEVAEQPAPSSTTTAGPTTSSSSTPTTSATETTIEAVPTAAADDTGSSSSSTPIVVAVVGVVIVVAAIVAVLARRRSTGHG